MVFLVHHETGRDGTVVDQYRVVILPLADEQDSIVEAEYPRTLVGCLIEAYNLTVKAIFVLCKRMGKTCLMPLLEITSKAPIRFSDLKALIKSQWM